MRVVASQGELDEALVHRGKEVFVVNASRLSLRRKCPRAWQLSAVQGRQREREAEEALKEDLPLLVGRAVHGIIDTLAKGRSPLTDDWAELAQLKSGATQYHEKHPIRRSVEKQIAWLDRAIAVITAKAQSGRVSGRVQFSERPLGLWVPSEALLFVGTPDQVVEWNEGSWLWENKSVRTGVDLDTFAWSVRRTINTILYAEMVKVGIETQHPLFVGLPKFQGVIVAAYSKHAVPKRPDEIHLAKNAQCEVCGGDLQVAMQVHPRMKDVEKHIETMAAGVEKYAKRIVKAKELCETWPKKIFFREVIPFREFEGAYDFGELVTEAMETRNDRPTVGPLRRHSEACYVFRPCQFAGVNACMRGDNYGEEAGFERRPPDYVDAIAAGMWPERGRDEEFEWEEDEVERGTEGESREGEE